MRNVRRLRLGGVLLVAVCLAVAGSLSFARRLASAEPTLGIEWVRTGSGPLALSVERGSAAAEAGLLPGDLLLRVDGQPVGRGQEDVNLPWLAQERPATITVRRGARTVDLTLRSRLAPGSPDLYGYLSLVGLGFLLSGLFVAVRWPEIRGSQLYAWLSMALFGLLVLSHTGAAEPFDWVVFALDTIAGAVAPALLIQVAVALARRSVRAPRLVVTLGWMPTLCLLLLTGWLVGLQGVDRLRDPRRAVLALERVEMLSLGVAVLVAVALLARSMRRSASGLHRTQMRWMLWGLGLGLAPFTVLYVLPWSLGAVVPPWAQFVSVVPLLIVPPAFTAGLIRYRLHDLDVLLRRGLVEVTAAFGTVAVYAVVVVVLRWLGEGGLLPLTRNGARYLGILPAAILYPQIRVWVRASIERAFDRKRYSYRATLLDWARDLNADTDLASLLARLRTRVVQTLDLREARVLLRTSHDGFEDPGADAASLVVEIDAARLARLEREPALGLDAGALPALPWARHLFGMRVKGRVRALLVVSDRLTERGEQPLTSEDRSLLSTLSAQAATAIEAARLVREVRQQADQVGRLQARQEQILESSGVGLLLADADGTILAWNRALEEIYAMPRQEAIGRRVADVFPLHLVRRIERHLGGAADAQEGKIYRQSLVNRAGERIVVNLSISPASQQDGADGARVVTFDDVTDRITLEEQVSRQERLASLGMLAAGVAHEINTPLTGISSYTQLLLEDLPPGDPRHAVLEKIEAQTRRVSGIANSLLNLARPERASFEDLSLNDAVAEVMRLFEPEVRGLGITCTVALAPDLPAIRGHRGKLQQVLLNLLMNARDAVEEGGRIGVATSRREDRVVLEVTDDGVGIPDEVLPRIFDPFFTTKGRGQGTGLGLSISYGIVREHDGDMHVESVPGEMTRFRVELPLVTTVRALA